MIETKNLVKVYDQGGTEITVLNRVNLVVERGEMLSIMGPSGSGKSTLLNMLGALDRPTSGSVLVNGVDLSTLSDDELANLRNREMGFIFQQFNLIHRMDALGNVMLPMAIRNAPRGDRKERARQLLESVGLGDRLSHKPTQMSGGEQQRVAIARSLANDPNLILCDELTGNLDSKTGQEIMQLLRKLNVDYGKTFVLITHDPAVAEQTDRLLQIKDGTIAGEKRLRG